MSFAERNICETVLSFLCLLVLLITIFQRKCNNKFCHCKPRNTRQFEKNNHVSASASPQKLQISGFRFDPATPPPSPYHLIKVFNTIRDLFIFHIIKDENLFDFKSAKKKSLIGLLQLTFLKKPAY